MVLSKETALKLWRLRTTLREKLLAGTTSRSVPTLYHYTDAVGLMGIVTSGEVWATHYAYLNDASEFKYAVGLMREVIEEATTDAEPDSWKHRFRRILSKDYSSPHTIDWEQDADEQQFVACFSEDGDGLGQWRGYGKSIGGYSLGFRIADLQAIERRINDSQQGKIITRLSPQVHAEFLPCWYDQQEQKALIAEGFAEVLQHCATTRYSVDEYSLAALLRAILRPLSPCFKDPAFKDEHEWRLIVKISRPGSGGVRSGDKRERTDDDLRMDQIATVYYRRGEYSLIPYLVVPMVLSVPLELSEVVVGPTPLPENARAAALQLLLPERQEDISFQKRLKEITTSMMNRRRIVCSRVTNSTIPFRRV